MRYTCPAGDHARRCIPIAWMGWNIGIIQRASILARPATNRESFAEVCEETRRPPRAATIDVYAIVGLIARIMHSSRTGQISLRSSLEIGEIRVFARPGSGRRDSRLDGKLGESTCTGIGETSSGRNFQKPRRRAPSAGSRHRAPPEGPRKFSKFAARIEYNRVTRSRRFIPRNSKIIPRAIRPGPCSISGNLNENPIFSSPESYRDSYENPS